MILTIKQHLIRFTNIFHKIIFGHEMSGEMRKFLRNLGISFFGGTISSLIFFLVSVSAGRILGPYDYGRYAVFVALFSFIAIFISFGLETSIIRFSAGVDEEKKKSVLSILVIFFTANGIFWSLAVYLLKENIAGFFGIPAVLVFPAVVFSITNSIGTVFENFLKVLDQFQFVNIVRISQSVILLSSISLFYFFIESRFSLNIYILLNLLGLLFVLAVFLLRIKSYFKLSFDGKILKELFLFSSILFWGVISGFLIQNGTIMIIGRFIGSRDLGIYSAYYTLAALMTGQFILFFSSAYFPAVAQSGNKAAIAKKIEKIICLLGPIWIVFLIFAMLLGLALYGKDYPVNYLFIFLFAIYSFFNIYGSLFGFITISGGNRTIIRNLYLWWLFFAVMYFLFLLSMGILGLLTVYAVLFAYVAVFFINAVINRRYCNNYISSL